MATGGRNEAHEDEGTSERGKRVASDAQPSEFKRRDTRCTTSPEPESLLLNEAKVMKAPTESLTFPSDVDADHAARKRIEFVLRNSPCGLIISEYGRDFPIMYVNKIFEFMTGYEASEIIGRNCRFLQRRGKYATSVHHLVDMSTVRGIRNALEEGKDFRGEILNFRKDGVPLTNSLYITPICGDPNHPGKFTHVAGIQNFKSAEYLNLPSVEEERKVIKGKQQEIVKEYAADVFEEMGRSAVSDETCSASDVQLLPSTSDSPAQKRQRRGRRSEDLVDKLDDEIWTLILSNLRPKDLARLSRTCSRFRKMTSADRLWHKSLVNELGESETFQVGMTSDRRLWKELANDIMGLKNSRWRPFFVDGAIRPDRTNFALCSMGNSIILFGGEGQNGESFNDLFVLDFLARQPCWTKIEAENPPQGRWGHTFDRICDNWIFLFGGSNRERSLNDCYLLEIIDGNRYVWHRIDAANPPKPRSWHTSTVVLSLKFVIFGGCDASGNLLSDTCVLDLGSITPTWHEIPVKWAPPSRLGHSLCVIEGSFLFMFGGFANAGAVRLRTADAFTINIDDEEPSWRYLSGSILPSGAISMGDVPTPRLQHVAINLWNGVIAVLGGSTSEVDEQSKYSSTQVFIIRPQDDKPRWERLDVKGMKPREAWGFSACRVGTSILLPADSGAGHKMDVSANNFYALSFSNEYNEVFEAYECNKQPFWLESNTRNSRHGGREKSFPSKTNIGGSSQKSDMEMDANKDIEKDKRKNSSGQANGSSEEPSTDAQLRDLKQQDAHIVRDSSPGSSNGGSGTDDSVSSPNHEQLPLFLQTLVHANSGKHQSQRL